MPTPTKPARFGWFSFTGIRKNEIPVSHCFFKAAAAAMQ
jgi:hypothetical protein